MSAVNTEFFAIHARARCITPNGALCPVRNSADLFLLEQTFRDLLQIGPGACRGTGFNFDDGKNSVRRETSERSNDRLDGRLPRDRNYAEGHSRFNKGDQRPSHEDRFVSPDLAV
jgi:hypothetical protein